MRYDRGMKTEYCRNILVIEDDESIRSTIADVLELEGYDTHTAANGKVGLAVLDRLPGPTLVLLDMMMPEMNGWEFLAAHSNRPTFSDISVVLVTAAEENRALLGPDAPLPVDGMLRKPIHLDKLLKIAGQYCLKRSEVGLSASAVPTA
jgi:CheY-like chemotaxis protein